MKHIFINGDVKDYVDSSTIPGWNSFKFHSGAIIPVNDRIDFINMGINRRFFQYGSVVSKPSYSNMISSGVENILVWEPRILLGCIIALAVLIPIWLKHL